VLEAVFDDGDFPRPEFVNLTHQQRRDPSLILKSTCLDMKWTFLSIIPSSIRRNSTHSIHINLVKIFNHTNGFVMSNMKKRLTKYCLNTKWDVFINGDRVSATVGWPQLPILPVLEKVNIARTHVQFNPRFDLPYFITKLHFCSQVRYCFYIYGLMHLNNNYRYF